ncbi:MAG TPA: hypothetical protein VGN83_07075 [Falsiroseomonas sp.]|nr:hypothetical protein [Falsiroseomonas sp.]
MRWGAHRPPSGSGRLSIVLPGIEGRSAAPSPMLVTRTTAMMPAATTTIAPAAAEASSARRITVRRNAASRPGM